MKLRFDCRDDQCPALIEYHPLGTADESLSCPRCDHTYTIHESDRLTAGESPPQCSLCRGEEFFKRKNFPQKTGLAIVILAGLLSIYYFRTNALVAYGVLGCAVIADLVIYYVIGTVRVCYRCRTEYWGLKVEAQDDWFDLATSEKYL